MEEIYIPHICKFGKWNSFVGEREYVKCNQCRKPKKPAFWRQHPRNEINFLPHIAEEIINEALPNVGCAVEPIGGENSHRKMPDLALFVGIKSVVKGGAIVPLQVVKKLTQLLMYYVEGPAVWPVVA